MCFSVVDFCWTISHGVLGHTPWIFVGRPFAVGPYPMDFCWVISLEFLLEAYYHAFLLGGHGPCTLIVGLSHAHLLWDIPCIFVGRSYHMHIYCGAISCAFLLDHSPCTFNVGPESMHSCWEVIAHAHLLWDQIPCIFVGRS